MVLGFSVRSAANGVSFKGVSAADVLDVEDESDFVFCARVFFEVGELDGCSAVVELFVCVDFANSAGRGSEQVLAYAQFANGACAIEIA